MIYASHKIYFNKRRKKDRKRENITRKTKKGIIISAVPGS